MVRHLPSQIKTSQLPIQIPAFQPLIPTAFTTTRSPPSNTTPIRQQPHKYDRDFHRHRTVTPNAATITPTSRHKHGKRRPSTSKSTTANSASSSSFSPSSSSSGTVNDNSVKDNMDDGEDPYTPEKLGFLHVATITTPHGLNGDVKATITTDFPEHRLSPNTPIQRYLLLKNRLYPRPTNLIAARKTSRSSVYILRFAGVENREAIRDARLLGARLYIRARDTPPLARGEFHTASLVGLRVCMRVHGQDEEIGEGDDNGEGNDDDCGGDNERETYNAFYETTTRRHGVIRADAPIGYIDSIITASDLTAASGSGASAARVANDLLQIRLNSNSHIAYEAIHTDAEGDDEDDDDDDDDDASNSDGNERITRCLLPFVHQLVPVVDMASRVVVIDPPPGLLAMTVVNEIVKRRKPRALLPASRDV